MSDPGKESQHRTTFDNQLIELESVDSTNNYAMGLIHAGLASDGLVCLARYQSAGKGQRGRTWQSEAGQNLIMSLVIKPAPLILSQQFLFSAAVAMGILNTVQRFEPSGWRIKWPNDIYHNDRKAAGILIESLVQGKNWSFSVVGVGMNLNQENFPADIPNAISLKQITGKNFDPVTLTREMVPAIESRIRLLREDPSQIFTAFNKNLYKLNEPVSLKKGEDMILTRITGVDEQGLLITENGVFALGEVEFVVGR